ncbi:unnamed protein product [Globisporangium polare]
MGPSESGYPDSRQGYGRQLNILELITTVQNDPETRTCSAQLAKKVLKYRNLLHFVDAIDVCDPKFDAARFFGVEWLKVGSIEQATA